MLLKEAAEESWGLQVVSSFEQPLKGAMGEAKIYLFVQEGGLCKRKVYKASRRVYGAHKTYLSIFSYVTPSSLVKDGSCKLGDTVRGETVCFFDQLTWSNLLTLLFLSSMGIDLSKMCSSWKGSPSMETLTSFASMPFP